MAKKLKDLAGLHEVFVITKNLRFQWIDAYRDLKDTYENMSKEVEVLIDEFTLPFKLKLVDSKSYKKIGPIWQDVKGAGCQPNSKTQRWMLCSVLAGALGEGYAIFVFSEGKDQRSFIYILTDDEFIDRVNFHSKEVKELMEQAPV